MTKKTTKSSSKTTRGPKVDAYERITNAIIALLEAGTVPWRRPWNGGSESPRSLATGKAYRGINVFILHCAAMSAGYRSPFWCTFNQARKRGGSVRRGERGTTVVLWRWIEKQDEETGKKKTIPFLRTFTVFNVEQCEGVEGVPGTESDDAAYDHEPIEVCEAVVAAMPKRPRIEHVGSQACYSPTLDEVRMPAAESFYSPEEYYATLFHELGHATGHSTRLDRKELSGGVAPFGSTDYSREELVAEMTAAFLCGETGIDCSTISNSAAYVAGWLERLREDKKAVVVAAQRAQKAADFVLDRKAPTAKAAPEATEEAA